MSLKPLGNPVSRESRGVGAIFIQMLLLFLKKLFKRGGGGDKLFTSVKTAFCLASPPSPCLPPSRTAEGSGGYH